MSGVTKVRIIRWCQALCEVQRDCEECKDYKILGYEETTSLVLLADNLLKF